MPPAPATTVTADDSQCCVCHSTFEIEEDGAILIDADAGEQSLSPESQLGQTRRVLQCMHSCCSQCLLGMIKGEPKCRYAICPCLRPHPFFDPSGEKTNVELIAAMPTSLDVPVMKALPVGSALAPVEKMAVPTPVAAPVVPVAVVPAVPAVVPAVESSPSSSSSSTPPKPAEPTAEPTAESAGKSSPPASSEVAGGINCTEPGCSNLAKFWCSSRCGSLCWDHDHSRHSNNVSLAEHQRCLITEKAEFLAKKSEEKIAMKKANLAQVVLKLQEWMRLCEDAAKMKTKEQAKEKLLTTFKSEEDAITAARAELDARAARLAESKTKAVQPFVQNEALRVERLAELKRLERDVQELKQLSTEEAIHRLDEYECLPIFTKQQDEFLQKWDVDPSRQVTVTTTTAASSTSSAGVTTTTTSSVVTLSPSIICPQSTGSSAILEAITWLDASSRAALLGFMSGVDMSKARLLYRATRDGLTRDDFYKCVATQGPTLTLMKVAGNANIIGAYTAVPFPKQPAKGSMPVVIPDPSGKTFLFSLVNAYSRPFRLSLKDNTRAITSHPILGASWGSEVVTSAGVLQKALTLVLQRGSGKSFMNDVSGCLANDPSKTEQSAYQLDAFIGSAPTDFKLDEKTLAGTSNFSCTDIEVIGL